MYMYVYMYMCVYIICIYNMCVYVCLLIRVSLVALWSRICNADTGDSGLSTPDLLPPFGY